MQDKIKKLWNDAEGIVILAGAGMGVDSGLPDFRGNSGLWTKAKENFLKYATARAFDEDPVTAWNFLHRANNNLWNHSATSWIHRSIAISKNKIKN